MTRKFPRLPNYRRTLAVGAVVLLCAGVTAGAPPDTPPPEPVPERLTLDAAVNWALRYNPQLAAQRQQHGIAAAQVVIADTYPFNPVMENRVQQASGPFSATITNFVPFEDVLLWEIELRGQRGYRRQSAAAGLSRTDWQIAFQEQLTTVAVLRAFTTLLYRQEKLRLAEETLRFNEELVERLQKLVTAGKLTGADLLVARTEASTSRDVVGASREAVVAARYDLYRALGVVDARFELQGRLELPPAVVDAAALQELALERRADLRADEAAVAEAQANLRLTVANRYGNPSLGPAFTYDPTRISMGGIQLNFPLPLVNTHRGEIQQNEAQVGLAVLNLRETEVTVRQEVASAVARLAAAESRSAFYRAQLLPELRKSLEDMEKLFLANVPGVDLLRLIDVRRKLLVARDSYLDALWRVGQARVDLIAAVGVPGLTCGEPPATALPPPTESPPP